jgi:hypothetical protein
MDLALFGIIIEKKSLIKILFYPIMRIFKVGL